MLGFKAINVLLFLLLKSLFLNFPFRLISNLSADSPCTVMPSKYSFDVLNAEKISVVVLLSFLNEVAPKSRFKVALWILSSNGTLSFSVV
ncbi:hypothetical protein D3C72_1793230 [compost metagenome]